MSSLKENSSDATISESPSPFYMTLFPCCSKCLLQTSVVSICLLLVFPYLNASSSLAEYLMVVYYWISRAQSNSSLLLLNNSFFNKWMNEKWIHGQMIRERTQGWFLKFWFEPTDGRWCHLRRLNNEAGKMLGVI